MPRLTRLRVCEANLRELQRRAEVRGTAVEALLALLDDSIPPPVRDQLRHLGLYATAERLAHAFVVWDGDRITAVVKDADDILAARCRRRGFEPLARALRRLAKET